MNIIEFLENFPSYEKVQVKAINEDESTHNYDVEKIDDHTDVFCCYPE